MHGWDTSDLWQLASADAGMQYLQLLFGCECIHCAVAAVLASKQPGWRLPLCSLLHQPECDDGQFAAFIGDFSQDVGLD